MQTERLVTIGSRQASTGESIGYPRALPKVLYAQWPFIGVMESQRERRAGAPGEQPGRLAHSDREFAGEVITLQLQRDDHRPNRVGPQDILTGFWLGYA